VSGHRPVGAGHLTSALAFAHMPRHVLALLAFVALALVSSLRAVVVDEVKPAERDDDGSEPGETAGGWRGAGQTRSRDVGAGSTPLPKNPERLSSVQATPVSLSSVLETGWLSPLPSDPVRAARREAALVVILEGLRECLEPLRSGNGDGYPSG